MFHCDRHYHGRQCHHDCHQGRNTIIARMAMAMTMTNIIRIANVAIAAMIKRVISSASSSVVSRATDSCQSYSDYQCHHYHHAQSYQTVRWYRHEHDYPHEVEQHELHYQCWSALPL